MRLQDLPWSKRGALLDYPMIWKDYARRNYVTGENWCPLPYQVINEIRAEFSLIWLWLWIACLLSVVHYNFEWSSTNADVLAVVIVSCTFCMYCMLLMNHRSHEKRREFSSMLPEKSVHSAAGLESVFIANSRFRQIPLPLHIGRECSQSREMAMRTMRTLFYCWEFPSGGLVYYPMTDKNQYHAPVLLCLIWSGYMEDWPTTFRADLRTYADGPLPTDHFGQVFGYYVSDQRSGHCIYGRPAHEVSTFDTNDHQGLWTKGPSSNTRLYHRL